MTKGTLKTIEGDVTNPQRSVVNEIVIIPHVCNDQGIMGSGVAFALKKAFSTVEYFYLKSGYKLGTNSWVDVDLDKSDMIIVNMVAQTGFMNSENSIPLKYSALIKCMESVRDDVINLLHMKRQYDGKHPVIHCPEFGGLRAGGNFEFVLELIREIWLEHGIDVVIYKFEEK